MATPERLLALTRSRCSGTALDPNSLLLHLTLVSLGLQTLACLASFAP